MSRALTEAAESSGMALTLLPVLYCRSGFSNDEVSETQKRFFNTPDRYLRLLECCEQLISGHSLHKLGIAPHSLRAVAGEQLEQVLVCLSEMEKPVHIHIAEQPGEVEECQSVLGRNPVDWLMDNFEIDSRWCLVHATHMGKDEMRRAAASGVTAGLCPVTEADLGDGLFPAESWLNAGGKFGIGSDSNLRVSVAEELRLLEFGCRLRTLNRNVLAEEGRSCGSSLYQHALEGGAQAVLQNVGKIEPAYRADLLELDSSHPLLENRVDDDIIDTWLFAGGNGMLRSVWVAGELQVEQGRHVLRPTLEASFRQTMKELV
jgi:formiminoglutamate deiminase